MRTLPFTGLTYAVGASAVLALLSTLGDFIWAKWLPTHQVIYGLVHGAVLCLAIGAVLGGFLATGRAVIQGALGALVIGLLVSGGFYLLYPAIQWAAMFVTWMALWILMSLWFQRVGNFTESSGKAAARGVIAALLSGLAFYAISGIWLKPDPNGPNYWLHFGCWLIAFLPGFVPLLASLETALKVEPQP